METRVFLGRKPERMQREADGRLNCDLPPQLSLSMPVLFSAMSYGSISYNAVSYTHLVIAAEDYENIYVVDGASAAMGTGILVELAFRLLDAGASAQEIAKAMDCLLYTSRCV